MRDKILKILKIRIDAINRNIDNLNYLNSELEKNTNDLNYIQDKIDIFAANNILNFDNLSLEDFEKVLLMIDPSVADVFQDKTCNYQGIMYIIQGIRQGISLELTDEQANAIRMLIQEMINKKSSLEDVIANLNESKSKLPETEMAILTSNLKKFQTIISKIEENLYITEVDDIIASLEFANVSVEEKVGIFEFMLRYNTKIYINNQTPIEEDIKDDEYSLKEINVPEFHYEPINIYDEVEDTNEDKFHLDDDKFTSLEKTNQIPVEFPNVEEKKDSVTEPETLKNDTFKSLKELEPFPLPPLTSTPKVELPHFETEVEVKPANEAIEITPQVAPTLPIIEPKVEPLATKIEVEPPTPTIGPETAELEDIIGQIDAKLKEIEKKKELPKESFDNNADTTTLNKEELTRVFNRFNIDTNLVNEVKDVVNSEVENVLVTLNENNILDLLRERTDLLVKIIALKNEDIKNLIATIKTNFVIHGVNLTDVINEIIKTIPILLINENAIHSFIKNVEFLKVHGLNLLNIFDNYKEILIVDSLVIEDNYSKVSAYNLKLNDFNVKYLLYNKNALENIDYYLEAKGSEKGFLGREEEFNGYNYILKNPYKINNISREVLIKLRYASENNRKIYGNKPGILSGEISNPKVGTLVMPLDYKNLYFANNYDFIEKKDLDTYMLELESKSDFNMEIAPEIKELDGKYKIDDLRYKIGDLVFSRPKTIRIYNFLITKGLNSKNALLIALTYNSVIKKEEYADIKSIITSIKEGGN